jgi:hypothetical protein
MVNGSRNFYPEGIAYDSPGLPRSGYPGMGFIITTSTLKGLRSVASASPKPRWGMVFRSFLPQGSRCATTLGYLITSPRAIRGVVTPYAAISKRWTNSKGAERKKAKATLFHP